MTDTKHWCVSMSCFLPLQYTVQSMRRVSSCSYQSAEKFVKGTSLLGKIVPEWNRATVWSSSFFFKGSFHLCVIIVSWEGDFIFFSTASFACLILVWSSFVQICFHSYLLDVKRKSVFFFYIDSRTEMPVWLNSSVVVRRGQWSRLISTFLQTREDK